jgi:hypothetical protein
VSLAPSAAATARISAALGCDAVAEADAASAPGFGGPMLELLGAKTNGGLLGGRGRNSELSNSTSAGVCCGRSAICSTADTKRGSLVKLAKKKSCSFHSLNSAGGGTGGGKRPA